MLIKTRAIVLHQVKYGESSLILTLYTERHGRLSCMVSGVRSKKSRFPMTFFQPLTLIEAELYYKPNRELHRLKEMACPVHYVSIPFVIAKSTVSLFLAEILYHTLHEAEGNSRMFDFLYYAFQLLDTRDEGIADFHVWFLLHYARFLGFSLDTAASREEIDRSHELRVFRNLPDEAVFALAQLLNTSMADPGDIRMGHENRMLLLDRIMKYYEEHLGGMGKIRSLQVLKEIFGD
jgi:DNA repair protein RecO (recombination protein O)